MGAAIVGTQRRAERAAATRGRRDHQSRSPPQRLAGSRRPRPIGARRQGSGQARAQVAQWHGSPEFPGPPTPPSSGTGDAGGAGPRGVPRGRRARSAARPAGGCLLAWFLLAFAQRRAFRCPRGSLSSGTTQPPHGLFLHPGGGRSRVATGVPRRGTLPLCFRGPKALDLQGLGDPAPSRGVRVDGVPKLRFSTINFRAWQKKNVSGDRTTPPRPVPVRLAFAALGVLALSHSTPSAQQVGRGTGPAAILGCQPKNPKRRAVCPGKQASRSRLPDRLAQ